MKSFFVFAFIVSYIRADPHVQFGNNPPQLTCPSGFTLTGKKCEQIITQTPQIVCPGGILDGDTCSVYAALQTVCPPGTVMTGKECTATDYTPAHSSCPLGFQDSDAAGCVQTKALSLIDVCDAGIMDEHGQCILIETAEMISSTHCPPGYTDDGKGCVQLTQYDCSPPPTLHGKSVPTIGIAVPPPTPRASTPLFGGYRRKKRMLGIKRSGPVYAPIPVPAPPPAPVAPPPPPVVLPPIPPPSKVSVVQQMCQRRDFANAIVETKCPPGYTEVGKKCVLKQIFPPTSKCVNGLPASQCVETLTTPRLYTCTSGQLVGEQCQHITTHPLALSCPAGYQMIGHQCAQFTSPQTVCAPGLILEGNTCVGRNYADPAGVKVIQCTGKGCWQNL